LKARTTVVLHLAALGALCAVAAAGCLWGRGPGSGGRSEATALSGPEAERLIARARENLYSGRPEGAVLAARLADSVINHCDVPRYVWEAFLVKGRVFQASKNHAAAWRAAREGIQTILTSGPGPLGDEALTALKMLLPVYVESAVLSRSREEAGKALRAWKAELDNRYARAAPSYREAADSIDAEFELLEEMTEQYTAARKPEAALRSLVHRYLRLFNSRNTQQLSALLAPASPLLPQVREGRLPGKTGEAAGQLFLASAIRVELGEAAEEPPSAAVTCDLLATSAAGWAELVRDVRFHARRSRAGCWGIETIEGHP